MNRLHFLGHQRTLEQDGAGFTDKTCLHMIPCDHHTDSVCLEPVLFKGCHSLGPLEYVVMLSLGLILFTPTGCWFWLNLDLPTCFPFPFPVCVRCSLSYSVTPLGHTSETVPLLVLFFSWTPWRYEFFRCGSSAYSWNPKCYKEKCSCLTEHLFSISSPLALFRGVTMHFLQVLWIKYSSW